MTLVSTAARGGGGGVTVLSYVQFTSAVSIVSNSEAAPTDVVDAVALTFDGSTLCCVEFYAPSVFPPNTANNGTIINLWDGATALGRLAYVQNPNIGGVTIEPVLARRFLTPTAGAHTFKVQAWASAGTGTINGGTGGAAAYLPGYIRVTSGS